MRYHTISEILTQLKEVKRQHGDLNVSVCDPLELVENGALIHVPAKMSLEEADDGVQVVMFCTNELAKSLKPK